MLCLCKVKASARAVLTYTGEFPGDAPQKIEIVGCSDFERNNDIDLFWKGFIIIDSVCNNRSWKASGESVLFILSFGHVTSSPSSE